MGLEMQFSLKSPSKLHGGQLFNQRDDYDPLDYTIFCTQAEECYMGAFTNYVCLFQHFLTAYIPEILTEMNV